MGFGRCAALSGAVIWFINAAITRDNFPTARLNAVSPRFSGEPLEVPLCPFPPSASLILPSWLLLPLRLPNSLLLSCLLSPFLSFFFFYKSFADSASVSLHPFVLDSFAPSVSLLFMFISHVVSVFVTLPSVCAWQWHSQDRLSAMASQGYVKHEMRKEVSG